MEHIIKQQSEKALAENENIKNDNSVDDFQKFIYELFEKNGILNDIRAYLRGHIVNILRNAKTGDTPACHKHFTQRLELRFQALNILIVEYFMRSEFSYSLSVFVSEIPLPNMVFGFAKSLMQNHNGDITGIRFTDSDVWSILNYLGVQCDSDRALQIVQMYRSDEKPSLLQCILKCLSVYHGDVGVKLKTGQEKPSQETLTSTKSSNLLINSEQLAADKCEHLAHCTVCQMTLLRYKNEYKKKKHHLYKNMKSILNPLKSEDVMKNMHVLERSLIEEMFQELKSVYEAEMGMVKRDEEDKLKRCMTNHVQMLQKQRNELEECFKSREAELQAGMVQKKRFLWVLARSLRDQHQHLTSAMNDVREETERLYAKEESLKNQLVEAEQVLRKRGEEMRQQIAEELVILDSQLTAIKKEKEAVFKEKAELEKLRNMENNNGHNVANEELRTHYELLKNELDVLKKYLETTKCVAKSVTETSTMTESWEVTSNACLNNSQMADKSRNDDERLNNQVVNDFKKKNVNFNKCTLSEVYRERACGARSSSSSGAEPPDRGRDALHRLKHENSRLRACAKQQKSHIEALSRACARVSLLPRARPAPAPRQARPTTLQSVNTRDSTNIHATMSVGWRKGAGEELSMFRETQPRILVPGDEIPFVGVLRDKERQANRRQLLSQWRALRARTCALAGVSKRAACPVKSRPEPAGNSDPTSATTSVQQAPGVLPTDTQQEEHPERDVPHPLPRPVCLKSFNREKSPKSVLREAKQNLRNIKDTSVAACEKSPSSVLREAKLRLRKLEIEAEAVEKSYLDYRRRQSELRLERTSPKKIIDHNLTRSVDIVRNLGDTNLNHSKPKLDESKRFINDAPLTDFQKSLRNDFDKYLRDYHTDINDRQMTIGRQNTANIEQPIPTAFAKIHEEINKESRSDYLDTPLTEFRKLYHSEREVIGDDGQMSENLLVNQSSKASVTSERVTLEYEYSRSISPVKDRQSDADAVTLASLRQHSIIERPLSAEKSSIVKEDDNLLRIELESFTELKADPEQISLFVQNSINIRDTETLNDSPLQSGKITVIVSPRDSDLQGGENFNMLLPISEPIVRSSSPEQEARLTRNDVLDAICKGEDNSDPKTELERNPTKDTLDESLNEIDDYPDNFSEDVDNYNSRSESVNSPISMAKISDDEILWDV